MFRPMAFAVIAALVGAFILSITFVPAACALLLSGKIQERDNLIVRGAKRAYEPMLRAVLKRRRPVAGVAVVFVVLCGWLASAAVATDVMPPARSDVNVMLKPQNEWPEPKKPKAQLLAELQTAAEAVPGAVYGFSQPIQLRFNELISGVRSDVAIRGAALRVADLVCPIAPH